MFTHSTRWSDVKLSTSAHSRLATSAHSRASGNPEVACSESAVCCTGFPLSRERAESVRERAESEMRFNSKRLDMSEIRDGFLWVIMVALVATLAVGVAAAEGPGLGKPITPAE